MDKKQSSLSIAIGMACVWMGTHFGPGVASGTQILVYWVKYGIWGTLASILAMALLGYCIYCSAEFSRIYKTYNYADWTKKVWGVDWIVYLLDFSFIIVSRRIPQRDRKPAQQPVRPELLGRRRCRYRLRRPSLRIRC